MNKKKIGIIIGSVVLVVAIVVGIILFLNKSNEEQLTKNLNTLGKQFYEDFYYPSQENSQEDVKKFFKQYEVSGIKVNLENIAKANKIDEELVKGMVNNKTKKECDKTNSYVIFYPKKPYGKTNYTIEVNLECGFKK